MLLVYLAMLAGITYINGVPSSTVSVNEFLTLLAPYAKSALSPLVSALLIALMIHLLRGGRSLWRRNTIRISVIFFALYVAGTLQITMAQASTLLVSAFYS